LNDYLQDLSPTSMICAIESHIFPFIKALRGWQGAEVHDESDILWSITDIPFDLFNSVSRARILPENIDATIQSVVAQAGQRGVPLLWWTGPGTLPADLGKHLERHGFVREDHMPGMAVDLAKLKENLPVSAGFTCQPVEDQAVLKIWGQVFGECFEAPDFAVEAFCDFSNYVNRHTMRSYLGWLDGKPVATSTLMLGEGVANIYNVGTIPAARRRGIGALMTALPLYEARAEGYRVGILDASEMGESVYRSLGFQEYCKSDTYMWVPEPVQGAG
jgi:hypothetical protein